MNIKTLLDTIDTQKIPSWLLLSLDSVTCGISVADATLPDMPLIYVNHTFELMTGYTAAEILGKNCRFLQGSDAEQPELDAVHQALAEQREVEIVVRNYRKDGTLFWNKLHLAPLFDEQEQLAYYVGIQTDVTAQKESQSEIQRQALLFYECLEAIPFGVLVIDVRGQIFFANKAANLITGKEFQRGTIVENLSDFCHITVAGTDRPYPVDAMPIMHALAGETSTVSNMEIRRADQAIPLYVSASPIHDTRGEVTHAIAIFADISEMRDKENKLAEESARHQAILNSSIDAIIAIDISGIIHAANPATERIFGYQKSELLGQNVKMLMPEPHHSSHDQYLKHYMETGKARVIGIGREVAGRRKDGSVFPIDLAVTKVELPQGILFKGIVRDISKRKAAEALIAKTLDELKKSQQDLFSLLNQFRVGSMILNIDLRVEFISESCKYFIDIDRDNAIGLYWDQVLSVGLQEKLQLQQLLGLAVDKRHKIALHCHRKNQESYWLECDVRYDPRDASRRIILLYDVTEIHQLRHIIEESRYGQMIGNSKTMQELYRLISDVAKGDWTVLIEGETGSGKELVAHAIHASSRRKEGSFITVNAASLSESMLASQLFGHRKGAFTGAIADQEGFFESAHGGTIFLDEIGDLPLSMQASLLRVLQEKEIIRVGETRARKVDVRIVTATHKDLSSEVRMGHFREDLLYRLRVARLYVPALRERKEDVPLLAQVFLTQSYRISDRPKPQFSAEAMRCLLNYSWPGNVRELKACVDYAVIYCQSAQIQPENLPPEIYRAETIAEPEPLAIQGDERVRILAALEKTGGNRIQAAKLLGISRATFYRRLTELDIVPTK